jgi:Fic family protein
VTAWVAWFARQCAAACEAASQVIDRALEKRHCWDRHDRSGLNDRQRKVLQRRLDAGDGGFEGGLNVEKYIKMTGAGKAIRYHVAVPGWAHGLVS